jgi:hypothetical protein
LFARPVNLGIRTHIVSPSNIIPRYPKWPLPDSILCESSPKPTVHSLDHGYAPSTMRHPFVGAEPQFMG